MVIPWEGSQEKGQRDAGWDRGRQARRWSRPVSETSVSLIPWGSGALRSRKSPEAVPPPIRGGPPAPCPSVPGRGCPCMVGIVCLQTHVVRQVLAPPPRAIFWRRGGCELTGPPLRVVGRWVAPCCACPSTFCTCTRHTGSGLSWEMEGHRLCLGYPVKGPREEAGTQNSFPGPRGRGPPPVRRGSLLLPLNLRGLLLEPRHERCMCSPDCPRACPLTAITLTRSPAWPPQG